MLDNRSRHQPTPFAMMDLPTDVQLLILSNMNLHTLGNITRTIPDVRKLYLRYPSSALQGALAKIDPQTRNLLLTACSVVCIIKSCIMHPSLVGNNISNGLADSLDTEDSRKIDVTLCDVLSRLCEVDAEV
jgi:hypothetical protein